ncbi:hypothetical protein CRG98_037780 [Punica granatum]|uniref:HAT C-terminal dimerisation domain-containing protein n=1 Tax=Punica granatum TaxID=22663 RepID=A0A2I0IEN8_PUNGR|nr:hypothetical protein CRG98_037780 [Punica granatum]
MAKDILAVPVSTVVSESAFSTSGRVLDQFRGSLNPKFVEALICAQDWLRSSPTPITIEQYLEDAKKYEEVHSITLSLPHFLPIVPCPHPPSDHSRNVWFLCLNVGNDDEVGEEDNFEGYDVDKHDDHFKYEEELADKCISDDDEGEEELRKYPEFDENATFGEVQLELHMLFPNLTMFKKAVTDYNIAIGKVFKFVKNDNERVRGFKAGCKPLIG